MIDPRSVVDPNFGELGTRAVRYLSQKGLDVEIVLVAESPITSDYFAIAVKGADGEIKVKVGLGELAASIVAHPQGAQGVFPQLADDLYRVINTSN